MHLSGAGEAEEAGEPGEVFIYTGLKQLLCDIDLTELRRRHHRSSWILLRRRPK